MPADQPVPVPPPTTSSQAREATRRLCRRVAEFRQQRGLTLDQLAERSGVSRSMLSQIERDVANPTFAVAYRIAQAFGVSLAALFDEPDQGPMIEIVRAKDRPVDDEGQLKTLHPLHMEQAVECYELRLKPGGDLISQPHLAGTHEFASVIRGRVTVVSGQDRQTLEAGDSAYYHADLDHALINASEEESLVYLVAVYAAYATRPSPRPRK